MAFDFLLEDPPAEVSKPFSDFLRRAGKSADFLEILRNRKLFKPIEKMPDQRSPKSSGRCTSCEETLTFSDFLEHAEELVRLGHHATSSAPNFCGLCEGTRPGTPGVPEPKLREEWEDKMGRRVRVTQEYQSGPFGGWALGVTCDGSVLGIRRGSVEKGNWFPFRGPSSTVDEVLLSPVLQDGNDDAALDL